MLTIYSIPESLYCAKLRIILRQKNLRWQELPPPGGYGSEEYKRKISTGNLPALVDGKLTLQDSEAISEYLNEKFPHPPMLPIDLSQRAKTRELSRFHDTKLEPALRALFPHIKANSRNPAIITKQAKNISTRLEQLGHLLTDRTFSTTDNLTLADCGFPITFEWIDALTPILDLKIEWPNTVVSYRNHLQNQPAILTELMDYQPKLLKFLHAKNLQ